MTNDQAIYILRNAAFLGNERCIEETLEAVDLAIDALSHICYGEWLELPGGELECSNCYFIIQDEEKNNYCPKCGSHNIREQDMGVTVEIDTLDKMCDAMCDNVLPDGEWYYFTFGSGQKHADHYVKLFGTYESTRKKMFQKFGSEWAFQYSEDEWKELENKLPEPFEM